MELKESKTTKRIHGISALPRMLTTIRSLRNQDTKRPDFEREKTPDYLLSPNLTANEFLIKSSSI